jgi:hypothetical protein
MSACKITVGKLLGQDAVREIENVPLSNSTINRCMNGMSYAAEGVLYNKLKNNSLSLSRLMSQQISPIIVTL